MVSQSASSEEHRRDNTELDRRHDAQALLIHGSAVQFLGKGVLLLGPSASGKSDLALRLIDAGAVLIADDQVRLGVENNSLVATAPARLRGLIELRGIGIMRLPCEPGRLDLAVDLEPSPTVEPLPEPETVSWHGIDLPKIRLDAKAASAVARIKTVLHAERVF
ncbi:MAG: HPr kinase/phosphorylase [Geminicoccaceae bacterium]